MGKEAVAKNAGASAHPKVKRLVEKLKQDGVIVTKPGDNLYTFVLKPEHRGKIIAVADGRRKKVVAFGTRYGSVVKKAKMLGQKSFSIMFAPEKGVVYTR